MRRLLVSSFLADVTQHIHSLRASGVMFAHISVIAESASIALRKSVGILCTVPEAIGRRAIVPKSTLHSAADRTRKGRARRKRT